MDKQDKQEKSRQIERGELKDKTEVFGTVQRQKTEQKIKQRMSPENPGGFPSGPKPQSPSIFLWQIVQREQNEKNSINARA